MQQIINFLLRNKTFLLFVCLFCIGLIFTIQSHSYHKSKFINSANFISGGIYNSKHSISSYFKLKKYNAVLHEENLRLKEQLYNNLKQDDSVIIDTSSIKKQYIVTKGKIIKNSFHFKDNILLLNKGENQGISQDLGVISSKGILGIVENTSTNYATILSILNTNSRISAQLKNSNHYGSLHWNTDSPDIVQLTEIPQKAVLNIGDTIITSGRSSIFPKGILIGTITNFNLDNAKNYYEINIKLFNDMTNINHVYIIKNTHKKEIDSLLNQSNE